MANIFNLEGIVIKTGFAGTLTDFSLQEGELGFTIDTHQLFIGAVREDGTQFVKEIGSDKEFIEALTNIASDVEALRERIDAVETAGNEKDAAQDAELAALAAKIATLESGDIDAGVLE